MVQLTYEEMNCIRGGVSINANANGLANANSPVTVPPADMAAAPSGDIRQPRPGSGGVY